MKETDQVRRKKGGSYKRQVQNDAEVERMRWGQKWVGTNSQSALGRDSPAKITENIISFWPSLHKLFLQLLYQSQSLAGPSLQFFPEGYMVGRKAGTARVLMVLIVTYSCFLWLLICSPANVLQSQMSFNTSSLVNTQKVDLVSITQYWRSNWSNASKTD